MANYKYEYSCPTCGTSLDLRMRVTQRKRRCPQCGTPITPEEIDRQGAERNNLAALGYLGGLGLIGILLVCAFIYRIVQGGGGGAHNADTQQARREDKAGNADTQQARREDKASNADSGSKSQRRKPSDQDEDPAKLEAAKKAQREAEEARKEAKRQEEEAKRKAEEEAAKAEAEMEEQMAAAKLKSATELGEDDAAASILIEIVQKFPNTKSADGARELLKTQIEKLVKGLKSKLPAERLKASEAVAKFGNSAATADYALCALIAGDPVQRVRLAALDALEKVQPKLHPLVVTLVLPPENNEATGYSRALKELPTFGRAGLPLIASQLQSLNPNIEKLGAQRQPLLAAHADALAKIALEDEVALGLLLTLPESPLAIQSTKNVPIAQLILRRHVAKQLGAVGKEKPETRKKIVPYFVGMLRLTDPEDRVLGANALAAFGSDAEGALPVLKKMNLDPSEQVRNAVRDAIAAIEKKDK
jgi:hypothetical protein